MAAIDEKYEDEVYRNLMKNFAASASSGDLREPFKNVLADFAR